MKNVCEALESRRLLAGYIQDTSFGDHGALTIPDAPDLGTPFSRARPMQTFLDAEGRVLVVNGPQVGDTSMTIRRYHADGTVDKYFNGTGVLTLPVPAQTSDISPTPLVTVLHDNSIVIAMRQAKQPLLQHYNVRGKYDPGFAAAVNTNYTKWSISNPVALIENLSTDSQGRVVWEQYTQSPVFSMNGVPQFDLIMNRFLPDGSADTTFGDGGAEVIQIDAATPASYKIQGKTINLRDDIGQGIDGDPGNTTYMANTHYTAPQIDSDGNVIVGGYRDYARGQEDRDYPYFIHLSLPMVYSFDRTGAINRQLIVGIDSSKATFVGGQLQYTGLQMGADFSALAPGNTLYMVGSFTFAQSGAGLAVFKPSGDTFIVSGFDNDFNFDQTIGGLQVFGNRVWALRGSDDLYGIRRLTALSDDATAGETVGLAGTFNSINVTFTGVQDDLPKRVVGFTDYGSASLKSLNLTEQEGSATIVNGVLKIYGTAGEDAIDITRRSNGRFVITGAGPTRSFAPASFSKIRVLAGGGNDIIQVDDFQSLDKKRLIIYGEAGNDTIYGSPGNDLLDGGSGNDSINSQAGVDTIYGQSGDDALYFNSDNSGTGDLIFGGSGMDTSFKADKDPQPTYNSVENL